MELGGLYITPPKILQEKFFWPLQKYPGTSNLRVKSKHNSFLFLLLHCKSMFTLLQCRN